MLPDTRLKTLRARLEREGVQDVKFYFEKGRLTSMPSSEVASKVADFIECYADGRSKAFVANSNKF